MEIVLVTFILLIGWVFYLMYKLDKASLEKFKDLNTDKNQGDERKEEIK